MTCKQRVTPGESLSQNLDELSSATEKIWKRIRSKTAAIKDKGGDVAKMPVNGDVRKLFRAGVVAAAEKTMLRAHVSATSNIAGCHAIR